MCWMALIPVAIGLAGSMMQAQGQKQNAQFQSGMMEQNAAFKNQTANETINAGNTSADWQRVRTGQAVGTQRSVQAANGIDVNSGSSAQMQDDTAMLGELDALTIQNNAAREAYGLKVQAIQGYSNANATELAGKNAKQNSLMGGVVKGAGSFFGGGGMSMFGGGGAGAGTSAAFTSNSAALNNNQAYV